MKNASLLLLAALPFGCQGSTGVESTSPEPRPPPDVSTRVLRASNAEFSLGIGPGRLELDDDEIDAWVRRSARAVSTYYGRFPVARVTLSVQPVDDSTAVSGSSFAQDGEPHIRIGVGTRLQPRELEDDWVLVHEMVHLATPSLPGQQLWLEEGIASYVEPIARVQSHSMLAGEVLRQWMHGMPQGEPGPGDRGLDHTHTWGRTYWGGALFCLLADVEIRERTENRFGLQDALRAVLQAHGGSASHRSVDEVIATGDSAVGVPVLRGLYDQQARVPTQVDLQALWTRLGIHGRGNEVHVDSSAPLAAALNRIFAPQPGLGSLVGAPIQAPAAR